MKYWNDSIASYEASIDKTVADLIGQLETTKGIAVDALAIDEARLKETVGDARKEYYRQIAETKIGRFVTMKEAGITVPIEGGNVSFTASGYSNQPTNCRLSFARNNRTFSAYRAGTGYGAAMDFGKQSGSWGVSYSQPDFGPAAFDAHYSSGQFTIRGSKTTLDGRAMASYSWRF